MTVYEAIRTRRSIRAYLPTPVEDEKLADILEAGRLSQSSANGQNWKFILVRDPDKLKLLYEASFEQPSMGQAPAAIVCCGFARRMMDCGQPTDTVDVSIALTHMMLQAHELGLGTCWLGHFKDDDVKEALDIPEDASVIAMTPLGYPAETPGAKPRKDAADVISYDEY